MHLPRYSAALGQGVNAGVADDIDGEARPRPVGSNPDLGADKYLYTLEDDFAAKKVAFAPQWVVLPDPVSGEPFGLLRQRYLLRYYYGSSDPTPPDLTVSIHDTLPADLDFEYQTHNPAMSFTRQGQTLTWQTQSPVEVGQSGEILLSALYEQPEPGRALVNQAEVDAGALHFDLQTTTEVPLFPPLIVTPGSGEICPDPAGKVVVSGTAQAGVIVKIYEDGTEVISTTTDADGTFNTSYVSTKVGINASVALTAKACAPGDPSKCSAASQVTLTSQQSFWCPQRSKWEDDVSGRHVVYRFRNGNGWFSTQNWVISGILGFYDTDLTLYACNCPGTASLPSSIWVIADGVRYDDLSPASSWYDFAITGAAHSVTFYAQCGSTVIDDDGNILIDPDGYIFDVTQGFDVGDPTLHAVTGVTVTAYVSMTEWGGWVPWPAHLYNNQQNPQVTGADGYYAFFTPPGEYYLQVEGIEGYQPWRSPVIEVIAEIVHLNVPYTPWMADGIHQVMLTQEGPAPQVVTMDVGESVEWMVELDGIASPEEVMGWIDNPSLRPLSDLDPLDHTTGWDGGMLIPGQEYRRQFTPPGTYNYSDGGGNSGQVIVTGVGVPTLLSPANGTSTSNPSVTFQWQAGAGAIPQSYNLDVDGTVITTTNTSWNATLSVGSHTWKVRAYYLDTYSDLSSAWTVEVISPVTTKA
jgi:hypothetical protein